MYPLPLFASRLLQRPLGIKISQQILSKRFSKALLNHWRTLSMNYVQIKLLYNMAASIKPSWKLLSPAATQQCFDWSWDYLPWLSWRQVVGRSYRVPSWLYFCGRNQQRWWSWPGACHGGQWPWRTCHGMSGWRSMPSVTFVVSKDTSICPRPPNHGTGGIIIPAKMVRLAKS